MALVTDLIVAPRTAIRPDPPGRLPQARHERAGKGPHSAHREGEDEGKPRAKPCVPAPAGRGECDDQTPEQRSGSHERLPRRDR